MATIEIDMSEFRAFFKRMEQAAKGGFRKEFEKFLDGLGMDFLRIVTDEYINRHRNAGEGQLINSFKRGDSANVWNYEGDGMTMTLEVGTSVNYAKFANYDHMTLDPKKPGTYFFLKNGEMARFVPGKFKGSHFEYSGSKFGSDSSFDNDETPPNIPGATTRKEKSTDRTKSPSSGMILKYHPVKGIHFWEPAIEAMEKSYPAELEKKLQEWLDTFFK